MTDLRVLKFSRFSALPYWVSQNHWVHSEGVVRKLRVSARGNPKAAWWSSTRKWLQPKGHTWPLEAAHSREMGCPSVPSKETSPEDTLTLAHRDGIVTLRRGDICAIPSHHISGDLIWHCGSGSWVYNANGFKNFPPVEITDLLQDRVKVQMNKLIDVLYGSRQKVCHCSKSFLDINSYYLRSLDVCKISLAGSIIINFL